MNLEILRCFLSVSRTLSFTKSATELKLTQPSVSRQIRSMEEVLGLQLFVRDKHSVSLTPAGSKLAAHLLPILSQLENVFEDMGHENAQIKGSIGFGCFPEIGKSWFIPKLIEFNLMHPQIQFKIEFSLGGPILEGVRSSKLDLGVVATPTITDTIRSYPLFEEQVMLVTRFQNPISELNVRDAHFIAYEEGDVLLYQYLVKISKDAPKHLTYVNSHSAMLEFLRASDSYAVLPHFSVNNEIQNKQLRLAHSHILRNPFYLIMPEMPGQGIKAPPRIEALKKFLLSAAKQVKW